MAIIYGRADSEKQLLDKYPKRVQEIEDIRRVEAEMKEELQVEAKGLFAKVRKWNLKRQYNKFDKNKDVIKNYKQAIQDLANSQDPIQIGERKHGRYKYCFSYNITKSHRLLYRVFVKENTIQLIDLDDHKNLFGRNNKA